MRAFSTFWNLSFLILEHNLPPNRAFGFGNFADGHDGKRTWPLEKTTDGSACVLPAVGSDGAEVHCEGSDVLTQEQWDQNTAAITADYLAK